MFGKRLITSLLTLILIAFIIVYPYSARSFANALDYKFNMSYIYFEDKANYLACIENTKGSINEISPGYFDLNTDGSLKLSSTIDTNFISKMHKKGIRVVPFLSNHWDRSLGRMALSKRDKLADQIINAIIEYNLDGVNVDLENLNEEDRDNYTDFVKLLSQKLPEGKILAVAVACNPKGLTKGWHGSYDYAALGKYSDYLMVMAYDEHYSGGSAGPVAGIKFVEDSIKYALERVPKEKIVLGIPFFGRIWKNGGGISGQGASLNDIEMLIAKYRGQVSFDYASFSPRAVITIKSSDEKPYIYGKKLDAGTYTIWYENEQSIKQKLSLVKKYGLKGTGSWSLGQETPNTWDYYSLWLNGHYYTDAQGHWALKSIIFVASKGWMIGNGSSSFAPDKPLTRAEAAVVLVRALGLKGEAMETEVSSSEEVASSQNDENMEKEEPIIFTDISEHWAKNEIEIAAQHRIVLGRGDGTFGPDQPITREELAVLVNRVLLSDRNTLASRGNSINDNNNSISIVYKDVSEDTCTWSYNSIIAMTSMGVITGTPDGRFLPKEKASRAEMATLLYRVWGY
ncbi:MAG: S-layer homology domain-containing protein [Firmicutes bacterium]|nr:S-layer homology domain-containing protein [Bacillota bacterium]